MQIQKDRDLIINETFRLLINQIDLLKNENVNKNITLNDFISIQKRENMVNQKISGLLCIMAGVMLSPAIWIDLSSIHDQNFNLAVGMISTFGMSCAAFSLARLIFAELKAGSEIRLARQVGDNAYAVQGLLADTYCHTQ